MPYLQRGKRQIFFYDIGAGQPVLLLHGITNSGRAFTAQLQALVGAGYRVIIPDHAGHGASSTLQQPITVEELAQDAWALLDHLQLSQVRVVGVSLGGMVLQGMLRMAPEHIQQAIIANSFSEFDGPVARSMARNWIAELQQPDGPAKRLQLMWPQLLSARFRQSSQGLITHQAWMAQAAQHCGDSIAHVAEGLVGFNATADLANIACPVLFIAGELDQMSAPIVSQTMAKSTPQGQCVVIADSAHLSNVDAPEAFNQHMLAFFSATD